MAGKGWGWKSTFNAWRSARGKADEADGEGELVDEMGQRRTIRLVTNIKRSETYQTIPTIEATPSKEERGSIRAFGISLLHSPTAPVHPKALVPSRARISPNKHRTPTQDAAEMPDPPAWIRPRAGSPTSQILSPPLHPHLFLHPTISNMSIAQVQASGASESGSDYGSDEDPHTRTTASRRSRVRRRRWLARTLLFHHGHRDRIKRLGRHRSVSKRLRRRR